MKRVQEPSKKVDGTLPKSTSASKTKAMSNSTSLSKNGMSSGQVDSPKDNGESLRSLGNTLDDVSSLAGFNQALGTFFDGIVPGTGATVEGDVALQINIPNVVNIKAGLAFSLLKTETDLWLKLSFSFSVAKVFDLYLAEIKAGLCVEAGLQAKGDDGAELMDLVSLAMLPRIQGKSSKLTALLYGDAAAFEERVFSSMDEQGSGEADWVKSSQSVGVFGGFKTRSPSGDDEAGGSFAIGYKDQDTIAKGTDGQRLDSSKKGLFIDTSFTFAGTTWTFKLDETSKRVDLSGAVTLKRCDKAALDSYLAGAVTSAANVIELARAEVAGKKDARARKAEVQLGNALGLLRSKAAATTATTIAAFKPASVSVEMKTLIVLGAKNYVSVTVSNVVSHEQSLLKSSSLSGTLKLGQRLLYVPF